MISSVASSSAPTGYWFPGEVIAVAVRWYLRYGFSYRDVEELLAERGVEVDHVTIYPWVQIFTAEFIDAARPARHAAGHRWFVDETYVKIAGRWSYLYRAVDQYGLVIDVLLSERRDGAAARAFFTRALEIRVRSGRGHHRPSPGLPPGHRPNPCRRHGTSSSSTRTGLLRWLIPARQARLGWRSGRTWRRALQLAIGSRVR